ncbi:hypothetical protein B0H10DRAFT_1967721 [Mycena sp. CBHHK59/15]|nr:hypothetical protein B0H10DRAFT_1967721 [Mycena sp. CBHHK59/15]
MHEPHGVRLVPGHRAWLDGGYSCDVSVPLPLTTTTPAHTAPPTRRQHPSWQRIIDWWLNICCCTGGGFSGHSIGRRTTGRGPRRVSGWIQQDSECEHIPGIDSRSHLPPLGIGTRRWEFAPPFPYLAWIVAFAFTSDSWHSHPLRDSARALIWRRTCPPPGKTVYGFNICNIHAWLRYSLHRRLLGTVRVAVLKNITHQAAGLSECAGFDFKHGT